MKPKKVVRMPLRRTPQQRTRPATSTLRARAATADEAYDEEEDYGGEDEPNMKFSHAVIVVLVLHVIAVGGIFAFNSIKARQTTEAKVAPKSAPAATTAAAAAAVAAPETTAAATTAPAKAPAAEKGETTKTAGGKTHTIQAGDTLTRVASLYSVKIEDLEKENEITSYTMLRVGQVLKIPTGSKAADSKPTAVTPKTAAPAVEKAPAVAKAPATTTATDTPGAHGTVTGDTYVVVKGDNPVSIAKKLHVSYNDLLSVNDIKDATKIQIGQKLKIPKK
jgi:LysM repeat protein